jgi:alpha-tubulin suppressor-like RCC1 family protein
MGSSGGWSGRRWGAALASGVLACASAVVAVGSVQSGVSALGVPSPSCPGARFAASVAAFSPADGLFDAGSNGAGQLGNGSTAPTAMFQQISLAPPPSVGTATVVAGTDFALATDAGSTLYAWGDNTDGQLGNGTPASSSVPVPVRMPQGVTAQSLAAGGNFSLAIGSDSNLYAWGDNSTGQLGNASPTGSNVPVQVPLAPGVTPSSIAAGPDFALMIDTSGAVWAWGAPRPASPNPPGSRCPRG